MTPNIGNLEKQEPNYSTLYLGDTENRVTEPGSCGSSPECSAEPRVILVGFVDLPRVIHFPHIKVISPFSVL